MSATIFTFISIACFAQQNLITGLVKDSAGALLAGATITIKGTTVGTVADIDGKFTMPDSYQPAESDVLLITYAGFVSQEIPVGNGANFTVQMLGEHHALGEVVVTALGIKRDENL